jgi:hypothetical protein
MTLYWSFQNIQLQLTTVDNEPSNATITSHAIEQVTSGPQGEQDSFFGNGFSTIHEVCTKYEQGTEIFMFMYIHMLAGL